MTGQVTLTKPNNQNVNLLPRINSLSYCSLFDIGLLYSFIHCLPLLKTGSKWIILLFQAIVRRDAKQVKAHLSATQQRKPTANLGNEEALCFACLKGTTVLTLCLYKSSRCALSLTTVISVKSDFSNYF